MCGDSLSKYFTKSFLTCKDMPAITFLRNGRAETEISYLELERDANRMANTVGGLGRGKGRPCHPFYSPNR